MTHSTQTPSYIIILGIVIALKTFLKMSKEKQKERAVWQKLGSSESIQDAVF